MLADPIATQTPPGETHWRNGLASVKAEDWAEAAEAFDRATREAPGDALFWVNLANAQRHVGSVESAEQSARQALALEPANELALSVLAECLAQLHRYPEALHAFEALAAAGCDDPEVMVRHGAMLLALLRPQPAAEVILRALSRDPANVTGHALLANAMSDQDLGEEAVECMKTALALAPWQLEMQVRLSHQKRSVADWNGVEQDIGAIEFALQRLQVTDPTPVASFSLLALPLAPALCLPAVAQDVRSRAGQIQPLPALDGWAARYAAEPRIRVGFLSYDFREHPVSQLLVEMIEKLDRNKVEVILYCTGFEDGSAVRQRIKAAADRFVRIDDLSDLRAAEQIRNDRVELLIDLMGNTRGSRLPILAYRPAPVQIGFLGFPSSLASPFLDYIIGDEVVTPLELAPLYKEKLAQMPRCFLPGGRVRPLPQPLERRDFGLADDAFVMAAFHQPFKILPETFDAWCEVMRNAPHAVLWLRDGKDAMRGNLRREAAARGVDPERLLFAGRIGYDQYFSRLALADVFVDTWPYNAHSTAADALWAGVPVVTLAQNSFASRVAASVLDAASLGDLAFMSVSDYKLAILALAQDRMLSQGLRRQLNDQRQTLPLFDSEGYARDFAALLGRMSDSWRKGQTCDHLLVQAAR